MLLDRGDFGGFLLPFGVLLPDLDLPGFLEPLGVRLPDADLDLPLVENALMYQTREGSPATRTLDRAREVQVLQPSLLHNYSPLVGKHLPIAGDGVLQLGERIEPVPHRVPVLTGGYDGKGGRRGAIMGGSALAGGP